MKLELKHLAPYLPYGLGMAHFDSQFKHGYEVYTLDGISDNYRYKKDDLDDDDDDLELLNIKEITFWFNRSGLNSTVHNVKPILRPLSDLTKEIEVNGEKFVPVLELAKISDSYYQWEINNLSLFHKSAFCNHRTGRISFSINTDLKKIYSFNTAIDGRFIQTNNPHLVYEKFIELHFDVFGLIEQGLAIDINSLES